MRRFLGIIFLLVGGYFFVGAVYNLISPGDRDVLVPIILGFAFSAVMICLGILLFRKARIKNQKHYSNMKSDNNSISNDYLYKELRSISNDYPPISKFISAIAEKLKTGIDDFGNPVDFNEMSKVIENVLVNMARQQECIDAVPRLLKVSEAIKKL